MSSMDLDKEEDEDVLEDEDEAEVGAQPNTRFLIDVVFFLHHFQTIFIHP